MAPNTFLLQISKQYLHLRFSTNGNSKNLIDFCLFYFVIVYYWFPIWSKCLTSWCGKNKLVLSINNIRSNIFEALSKSFIYKRNRSGLKTELCGTTQLTITKAFVLFFIDLNELSPTWEVAFCFLRRQWRFKFLKSPILYKNECFI